MMNASRQLFRGAKWLSSAGRRGCLAHAILGVLLLGTVPDRVIGEVILTVSDAQVIEGESGFLDVYLSVPSGTPMLAFYMIELKLTDEQGQAPSGVRFVYDDPAKKDFGKADRPVFTNTKAVQTAARPSLPGTVAAANDFLLAGEAPITDGAGLFRLTFETDLGSSGVYPVVIETDELRTNLFDGLANPVTIQAVNNGSITVVPEPATLWLLSLCGLTLLGYAWRKRRCRVSVPRNAS